MDSAAACVTWLASPPGKRRGVAMKARELMSRPVITVRPDTPTGEAAALLGKHQITALPVLDSGSRLVGMISEGDLLRNQIQHDGQAELRQHQSLVGGLMT